MYWKFGNFSGFQETSIAVLLRYLILSKTNPILFHIEGFVKTELVSTVNRVLTKKRNFLARFAKNIFLTNFIL